MITPRIDRAQGAHRRGRRIGDRGAVEASLDVVGAFVPASPIVLAPSVPVDASTLSLQVTADGEPIQVRCHRQLPASTPAWLTASG